MNHLPDQFQVQLAQPDQFLNPYRWVNDEENNFCPVVHARFLLEGNPIDAYAKLMDLHLPAGQIDCLNEISGWLIAKACGLPVANKAFIASIRASDLPPHAAISQRISDPDQALYFFCTEQITVAQARGLIPNEALVEEQARWDHCHATIALDEWLANPDRHLFNLIRKAKDQFALIDHGQLLRRSNTGPWWHKDELPDLVNVMLNNHLHKHTFHVRNVTAPEAVSAAYSRCVDDAAAQARNLGRVLHEISFWCGAIAPGQSAAWLNFLVNRVQNAKALLASRFRVLNLA